MHCDHSLCDVCAVMGYCVNQQYSHISIKAQGQGSHRVLVLQLDPLEPSNLETLSPLS